MRPAAPLPCAAPASPTSPCRHRCAPDQANAAAWTWPRAGHATGVALGLHRQRSTDVVDLTTCLVLHPELVALMPPLRTLLTRLQALHREGSVIANLLDSGPDVLLRTDAPLQLADRIALTEFARAHALPRIAWAQGTDDPEPVAILRPPTTSLCGHHDHTTAWRLPSGFGIG